MQSHTIQVGNKYLILNINSGEKNYRQRLLALGLLPGTEFTVTRMAPLGDPIEIMVRGFALSLRKQEASILRIQKVPA